VDRTEQIEQIGPLDEVVPRPRLIRSRIGYLRRELELSQKLLRIAEELSRDRSNRQPSVS
jgi:hypothetical protein